MNSGEANRAIPNSEILLLYEAKLCNPNGDPDEENRPRIDGKTNINLVSDVRLKRYFRDYIINKYGPQFIYVTKLAGTNVRADQRIQLLGDESDADKVKEVISQKKKVESKDIEERIDKVLKNCIDARLFGATIPIGGTEKERGASRSFTGPAQFSWGFSLHPVELVESSSITSIFAGREAEEQYGTIGKDWRLYYSLIAFYGLVSGRRARETKMTEEDLELFDNAIWQALTVQPTTRSKIGERPLLYLRIQYNDDDFLLGDLRRFIKVSPSKTVREYKDVNTDFETLVNTISMNNKEVNKIYVRYDEELSGFIEKLRTDVNLRDKIVDLPHSLNEYEVLSYYFKESKR